MNFIQELKWRGLIHDTTPEIEQALENKTSGYIGFDPTAPALTIGNLVTIMLLKIFQKHGHKPIVVMGGATGRIGDPSGKDQERKLLDLETLQANLDCQKATFHKLLNFEGDNAAEIIDNFDIFKDMSILDFLRNVGKHITVANMLSKDSVRNRMEAGISFTEFSYQLLQGFDFAWLFENKGVTLQMGGSDQWGNIVTGKDLISKMHGGKAHGLTCPLLTKTDGTKFGKSENGNIWLDASLTTPFEFFQFFLRTTDEDVIRFNRIFTLRPFDEVETLEQKHLQDPSKRLLQKTLAEDLTKLIHGEQGLNLAIQVSDVLFSKGMDAKTLFEQPFEMFDSIGRAVSKFDIDQSKLSEFAIAEGMAWPQLDITDLVVKLTKIFSSKREFRQALSEGAVMLNRKRIDSEQKLISKIDLIHGRFLFVEWGKKKHFLIEIN